MDRTCFTVLCALVLVCVFATPAIAEEAMVPDVVGLSVDDAKGLLEQAGFSARIESVQGKPVGVVASQTPGGLATRDTSGPVTLMVGGATPKPGMGAGDGMGDAPTGRTDPLPTVEPGPSQPGPSQPAPTARAMAWNGKAIPEGYLPMGSGPELPSVLGQTGQRARGNLRPWQVKVERTLAVPQLTGTVVNQWPPAGENVTAGASVTIVIAVTERPSDQHRYVPQAENRGWRDAIGLVERSGFVPQPVSVRSSERNRGRIIAQSPQPGTMALGGEAIRLYIGRGAAAYSADASLPSEATPTPAPDRPAAKGDDLPPAGMGDTPIAPGPDTPTPDAPAPVKPDTPAPTTRPVLSAPTLTDPPAGESYPFKYGADFKWTTVRGASGYELELQEELPSGAWQTKSTIDVSGASQHRPARIERGRYRWRVRGVTTDGGKGAWSEYRRLYMY